MEEELIQVGDIVRVVDTNLSYLNIQEQKMLKLASRKVFKVVETENRICKLKEVQNKRILPWIGMYRLEILFSVR